MSDILFSTKANVSRLCADWHAETRMGKQTRDAQTVFLMAIENIFSCFR